MKKTQTTHRDTQKHTWMDGTPTQKEWFRLVALADCSDYRRKPCACALGEHRSRRKKLHLQDSRIFVECCGLARKYSNPTHEKHYETSSFSNHYTIWRRMIFQATPNLSERKILKYIEILIVRRDDHNLRKSVDHR